MSNKERFLEDFLADFRLTGAFLTVVLVRRLRLTGRRLFTISFSCLLRRQSGGASCTTHEQFAPI
jgi:hypothetical protein